MSHDQLINSDFDDARRRRATEIPPGNTPARATGGLPTPPEPQPPINPTELIPLGGILGFLAYTASLARGSPDEVDRTKELSIKPLLTIIRYVAYIITLIAVLIAISIALVIITLAKLNLSPISGSVSTIPIIAGASMITIMTAKIKPLIQHITTIVRGRRERGHARQGMETTGPAQDSPP